MGRCGCGILILLISIGCNKPKPPASFEDPTHTVKLTYPDNWAVGASPGPSVYLKLLTGDGAEHPLPTQLLIQHGPPEEDLSKNTHDEIQTAVVDGLRKNGFADAEVIESETATLGGEPGRRTIITGHSDTLRVDAKIVCIFCVRGGTSYSVMGFSAPKRFPQMQKDCEAVAASFEFVRR